MEQRAVIKLNAKISKNAAETFILMQKIYGNACLSRSDVFRWHKRFLNGRGCLEDDEHTGRPISLRTSDSIVKVR